MNGNAAQYVHPLLILFTYTQPSPPVPFLLPLTQAEHWAPLVVLPRTEEGFMGALSHTNCQLLLLLPVLRGTTRSSSSSSRVVLLAVSLMYMYSSVRSFLTIPSFCPSAVQVECNYAHKKTSICRSTTHHCQKDTPTTDRVVSVCGEQVKRSATP